MRKKNGNISIVPPHIYRLLNGINPIISSAMRSADYACKKSDIKNFRTGATVFRLDDRYLYRSPEFTNESINPPIRKNRVRQDVSGFLDDHGHASRIFQGNSHYLDGESIHAEEDALLRATILGVNETPDSCFVFTRNKNNNIANSSRPCAHCMWMLAEYNIHNVFYLTVENHTNVSLQVINPINVIKSIINNGGVIRRHRYANKMRC